MKRFFKDNAPECIMILIWLVSLTVYAVDGKSVPLIAYVLAVLMILVLLAERMTTTQRG